MTFSYMYSMYFDSIHPLVNCLVPCPLRLIPLFFPNDLLSFLLF